MRKAMLVGVALFATLASAVHAAPVSFSGTIDALQVFPGGNGVYVRLAGPVSINVPGCSGTFGYGDWNDDKFTTFTWPSLLLAHSKNRTVTIAFEGCYGTYPMISWVQVNAT